jgi:hypothetical protein
MTLHTRVRDASIGFSYYCLAFLWLAVEGHSLVVTRPRNSNNQTRSVLRVEQHLVEEEALSKLSLSLAAYANNSELWGTTVFYDVIPSIKLSPHLIHESDGHGNAEKYYAGTNAIKALGKSFIVYASGIDNNPVFEKQLAALNASVFAFDCTNVGQEEWKKDFTFQPWCIGRAQEMNTKYARDRCWRMEFIYACMNSRHNAVVAHFL